MHLRPTGRSVLCGGAAAAAAAATAAGRLLRRATATLRARLAASLLPRPVRRAKNSALANHTNFKALQIISTRNVLIFFGHADSRWAIFGIRVMRQKNIISKTVGGAGS